MRIFRILLMSAGASAALVCGGWAAALAGDRPAVISEDDAACRPQGAPGTAAYVACRRALADAREQQKAIIQEQKRRDFDRLLGEGTGGFDESF